MNIPKLNVPDGSKKIIRVILGGAIAILVGALGLELTNNDWNLGTLLKTGSTTAAKVLRDKQGNVVTSGGKATDEYNCDDFASQKESQLFFDNAGGTTGDTNRLDGDKDGVACESLPAGQ